MNIVINGKNLQKRIINGQEVQKVIRNGVQIRPESTPPTPTEDYLCFTTKINDAQIRLRKYGTPNSVELEISPDKINWSDYTIGNYISLPNIGDKIYFRNKSETVTKFSLDYNNCYNFQTGGYHIEASGDVNYLLCKNSTLTLLIAGLQYCFNRLFEGCQYLDTAPSLPATILIDGCYYYMFNGCTSLTTAPVLPATTLSNACYYLMFNNCSSLITAPQLPATTLATNCYHGMFANCTSLITAPQLPATTVITSCYDYMFAGCTSLINPPELPATTNNRYGDRCYSSMFDGCSSLSKIPRINLNTFFASACWGMFIRCPLIKISETQTGEYQTPYRIPATGTGTTGAAPLEYMFYGTGGTFTGTPDLNTTYYTSNQVI